MKFTPGQAQQMLQLSPATFRHWKIAFPPLGGRNGYTPCFSPGDLLAMALIKTLTETVGIRPGHLDRVSVVLFEHCNRQSWAALERTVLLIEPSIAGVSMVPEGQAQFPNGLVIALPCRPVVVSLREKLLVGHEEPQQEPLRFPLTAVRRRNNGGGAS
jgi:hypothetical protein